MSEVIVENNNLYSESNLLSPNFNTKFFGG